MEDRGLSRSEMDYMKDIEEIHFGSTSDEEEEDEDEPRLRIDTSEDEEEEEEEETAPVVKSQNRRVGAKFNTKSGVGPGANPLLSLQQLVHSPFLNTEISSGAAAAAAALMDGENQGCKIFNPLVKDNRSKSSGTTIINVDSMCSNSRRPAFRDTVGKSAMTYNGAPRSSGGGVKGRKSGSLKRANSNVTNFQRMSPVSIEVVPTLSHLLMSPYESTPATSPESVQSDRTHSRLNYIVNKLHTSATEEEHLRQLQQLQQQSSPEAEDFKMFQKFLKSRHFQARCNSNNLEILPTAFGGGETSLISLVNSKGFRYNSMNAETRSTFHPYDYPSPMMPPLKRRPSESRNEFRMPPALTVIPKQGGQAAPRKTNCRRSPPPMVPIESIANFRKPLNEDNVVYRLKKLGTDIELEKNASSRCVAADDASLSVERICPQVTNNDKTSLPYLKPIPADVSRNSVVLTKLHPPPPSLIPITSQSATSRFVPILPNIGAKPNVEREPKKRPVALARPRPTVVQVLKKKKKNRLTAKSEYTRLAHQLVQAATPLNAPPKRDETKIAVPVAVVVSSDDVVLPQRVVVSPPTANEVTSVDESKCETATKLSTIVKPAPSNDKPIDEAKPEVPKTVGQIKKSFVFHPSQAIQVGELPNGRKMLSCDICSGVYHKMYSLKKHYYRNHINPKFVSEKHALMFKVLPPTDNLLANPKSKTCLYWCSICECLFDDKSDLSSHLTDHPPLALDNAARNNRLYVCATCNMVFPKKRTQVRHSKKCAKSNDDATEPGMENLPSLDEVEESLVEEVSNGSSKMEDAESEDLPKSGKLETSMMCLFCELSFTDTTKRKKHVLQHHHPKRKQQPCVYCKNKTFSDLSDLLKHICEMHSKRYFGCAICKIRFRTKEDLVAHNAESHDADATEVEKETVPDEKSKTSTTTNKNGKNYKCNQCTKVFSNTVEMGRHKKSAHPSRNNIKKVVSAFSASIDQNEQKYRSTIITTADYETEFYKNVCNNVKYNLEYSMDGRLEMKKSDNQQGERHEYADVGLDVETGTRSDAQAPLNFQDMYGTDDIDSRFIHNVSRLHLATQLTMLRKANLLDKELDCPLNNSVPDRSRSAIATRLALAEKPEGERGENEANDTSNDTVFSGEWIRTRNYICGTCFARFNNFWDMEDHRWIRHPNVYGFYYEFVAEQAPGQNWAMKRSLQSLGTLGVQANNAVPPSTTCTKCQKAITPVADFHKHILECGGDTTWTSMMFAAHTKRNKKWRPYGSRRRKNIARHRGLKRNIPTTPVKIIGPPRNRQKAGDTETIQRMIANLPAKRITRRVITFDDIDSKKNRISYNAQTSSNILTRKRRENLDTRGNASTSSSRTQQHLKRGVASSHTLIGTKNNTPYSKGNATSAHKKQIERQTVAKPEIEIVSEPQSRPKIDDDASVTLVEIETKEMKCEPMETALESVVKLDDEVESDESKNNDSEETKNDDKDQSPETEIEPENVLPTLEAEPKPSEREPEVVAELRPESSDSQVEIEQPESISEPKGCSGDVEEPEAVCERECSSVEVDQSADASERESSSVDVEQPRGDAEVVKTEPCSASQPPVIEPSNVAPSETVTKPPVTIIRADKKRRRKSGKNWERKKKSSTAVAIPVAAPVAISEPAAVKEEPISVSSSNEPVIEKKPVDDEPEPEKVSAPEPEEGEIDLESVIEPADESSPALPNTSVILAAMKETMSQTDAVISSMPVSVTAGKKRKRDDASSKCKKCGVKMETSGTTCCESCSESPAKRTKPAAKTDWYTCKKCRTVVPGKPPQRGDETCEKCEREKVATTTASSKKSAVTKAKDIRAAATAQPVAPATTRCRKCDAVCPVPVSSDGPAICDKCSRLQETVCLLCKSRYISDTNDKVCGKCMLAGSAKQKKRSVGAGSEDIAPAPVTTQVTSNVDASVSGADTAVNKFDDPSKPKKPCEVCRKETDPNGRCTSCPKKRKTSGQQVGEAVCDTCGKTWPDEENSGSPICRLCRQSYENNSTKESTRIGNSDEEDESAKCVDCSSIVQTAEVTLKKLCDGCSSRKKERRVSSEASPAKSTASVQDIKCPVGPNVFNGFAPLSDDLPGRNRVDEPKIDHVKEEPNHSPVSDHKTPMKNVKLICRGCYGVFDTVSSYKYHCDNCKHRSTEKKPLLSFAKRTTKGAVEPSAQPDSTGASFEILEGVQIKFVEMSGTGAPSDKSDSSKDSPSQIPLVVYESDSSPHKKSDGSRAPKKHKRNHSSPETIMDTIESVIKSVCYDNLEPQPDDELADRSVTDDDLPPVLEPMIDDRLDKVRDVLENDLETEQQDGVKEEAKTTVTEVQFEEVAEAKIPRTKSAKSKSKKKVSKKAKKATNAAKESQPNESAVSEDCSVADTSVDESNASKTEDVLETTDDMDEVREDLQKLSAKNITLKRTLPSNDLEIIKNSIIGSRLRARPKADTGPMFTPVRRTTRRSRTKLLSESLDETKNSEIDEPESAPVDEIVEDVSPKGKKKKSECTRNDAKKPKLDNANDLGFAVTKTNKTISKNATTLKNKKTPVIEAKNETDEDEDEDALKNDRASTSRKNSAVSETSGRTLRRRSSGEHSEQNGSQTPNENRSRKNSAAMNESQNEPNKSTFFDDRSPQSANESVELAEPPRAETSSVYGADDEKNSFTEGYETPDTGAQASTSWYPNDWDFLDHKSLGSILDTVNEILSRPEVSSCSSDSVDSFREEMMMFQHFGRDLAVIEKQEDESSKQDDETTTIIDLDEHSSRKSSTNESKPKVNSEAGYSGSSEFNEDCEICDQPFTKVSDLQSHMTNVHASETMNKNFKDAKLKQVQKNNQNGTKNAKHKCNHCQKVLQNKAEMLLHMKEHWKTFALSKSDNGSHLKNSIADKLEELLLDKALVNYLKSPQETQHRNNLPLKILNQISLAKKNQFTNWKSALAQVLDMDSNSQASTATTSTTTTTTTTTSSVPPAETVAAVTPEPKSSEKTKTTSTTESSNADPVEGYPCPMCNKTFQYTRTRNTHLIMVHAPRQSTHKHLIEEKSNLKKGDKTKLSLNKNHDGSGRNDVAREKIFHSYLMNDSVNTVLKKESLDDPPLPPKPTPTAPATTADTKMTEKRDATPSKAETSSSSSPQTPSTAAKTAKPNPNTNAVAKSSSNDESEKAGSKKKKPCRKKMSKKEMNLPAAIVKMKAEQALLQLCNSRFNRICSQ